MKPGATHCIIKFATQDAQLASHFRTVKLHADAGLKAPQTIARMLLAKVRLALQRYKVAFGVDFGSGAAERTLVDRFAREFDIKLEQV